MKRLIDGIALLGWRDLGRWTSALAFSIVLTSHALSMQIREWGSSYFDDVQYSSGKNVAIAAGGYHGLALKADGSVVGWGSDYRGQATPPVGNDYVAIAAGGYHSLALKADGSIVGWGSNYGRSGDDAGQATPPAGNDYVAISAGGYHSLALKADGSIVGWGSNYGRSGDDAGQATPPAGNDYVAVAAGGYHSLALKADGAIIGWGSNSGSFEDDAGQAIPPPGSDYVAIAAGAFHSVALKADGALACWGDNVIGQATPIPGNDYVSITAGGAHNLALKADRSIVGWGLDDHGQATPVSGVGYVAIAAGAFYSLALRADGSVVGWGDNGSNQSNPPAGLDYVAVASGFWHGLALKSNGSVVAWGDDRDRYGYGGQSTSPPGFDYVAIAAGDFHSLALKADGSIIGWGSNVDITGHVVFEASPPEGFAYAAIAAGGYHSLALKADGSIVGWGGNENEHMSVVGQATPPAGHDYVAIAAGECHSLALKSDGSVVGWGDNQYGEATTPAGNDYVAIAAGDYYSLALKADGAIVVWGHQEAPPSGSDFVAISAGAFALALKAEGSIVAWGWSGDIGQTTPPSGNGFVAISAGVEQALALQSPQIQGWTSIESDTPITGLALLGDEKGQEMAGVPMAASPATRHDLAHFASSSRWYTGIAIANPNGALAHLNLTAYANNGVVLATTLRNIQGNGSFSELASSLFGAAGQGTGWIQVSSDVPVYGLEVFGDLISGGIGALSTVPSAERLVLPHFVHSSRWWTGISILNPNLFYVSVTLKAYLANGTLLEERTCNIGSRGKLTGMVENLLPRTSEQTGWIFVESKRDEVCGMLMYGDRMAVPSRIAAVSAVPASNQVTLSHFLSDTSSWTGTAFVNPNETSGTLTITAYGPEGQMIAGQTQTLAGMNKTVSLVDQMFALAGNKEGWIEASATCPIVGLEILNAEGSEKRVFGLAAIEGQSPSSMALTLPYQICNSRWWTLLAMANPSSTAAANVNLTAFDREGASMGTRDRTIPSKGRLTSFLENLLGS